MATREAKYRLVLEEKDFVRALKAGQSELDSFAKSGAANIGALGKVLTALGPAGLAAGAALGAVTAGAGAAVAMLVNVTRETVAYGGKINDLSSKLSITAEAVQKLTGAFKLSGGSQEQMSLALSKMQVNLVNAPKAFDALGLSAKKLTEMGTDQALQKTAHAIAGIQNPAQQTAAAVAIFGKSGAELLPVLKELDENMERMSVRVPLSTAAIKGLDDFGDQVDILKDVWADMWHQIGAAIATTPELNKLFKDMTQGVSNFARSIGDHKAELQQFIANLSTIARMAEKPLKFVIEVSMGMASAFGRAMSSGNMGAAISGLSGPGGGFSLMGLLAGGVDPATSGRKTGIFSGDDDTAAERASRALSGGSSGGGTTFNVDGAVNALKAKAAALFALTVASTTRALGGVEASMAGGFGGFGSGFSGAKFDPFPARQGSQLFGGAGGFDLRMGLSDGPSGGFRTADLSKDTLAGLAASTASWEKQNAKSAQKFKVDWTQAIQTVATVAQTLFGSDLNKGGKIGGALGATGGAIAGGIIGGPIGAQIGSMLGGLIGGGLGSLFDRGGKKRAQQAEDQKSATQALSQLTARFEEFRSKTLAGGSAGLGAIFEHLGQQTDLSSERLARLGIVGSAVFGSLRASGMGMVEAVRAMPQALAGVGISAGSLGDLGGFQGLVEQNAGLVTAAESWGKILDSIRVTGSLTAETFAAVNMEAQAFNAELIEKGFTANQALAIMAPTLLSIRDAAAAGGYAVDATTASMIAQADQAGLFVGLVDPMKEMVEIQKAMVQVLAAVATAFGATIPASVQAMIDKMNAIPKSVDSSVNIHFNADGAPEGWTWGGEKKYPGEGMASGGYVPPRPGGWNKVLGEGGEGEWVIPNSKLGGLGGDVAAEVRALRTEMASQRRLLPRAIMAAMQKGAA